MAKRKISRNVVALGLVSFFTDLSSEMIIPVVLPLFMKAQGIAFPVIGLIEGVAESTASLLKLVSGWLSDRLGKRKALVAIGYGVSTVAKPLFAVAGVWWHFLAIRFSERIGKGIRTAPRDALVAASAAEGTRGVSFGLHRALDTAGAFMGLLSALVLVWVLKMEPQDFRLLFVIAFIPALVAVLLVILFVREATPPAGEDTAGEARAGGRLGPQFKWYLLIAGLFTLGNSSDAFLVLRADAVGFSAPFVIMLMLVMNAVEAVLATPIGSLSDRVGRKPILAGAFLVYAAVYFGLAFVGGKAWLWPLFAVYGVYYAMAEGGFRAMVADLAPANVRGLAYGLFHLVVGLAAVPASVIMGWLWDRVGVQYAFSFGAALAFVAMVLLLAVIRVPKPAAAGAITEVRQG